MLTQTQWRKYNMFKLLVASNNQNKIKEYKDIFKGYDVKISSLKDLNIAIDSIENGKTYYENALIKANACKPFSLIPTISDDSGIEIDGLGGAVVNAAGHFRLHWNTSCDIIILVVFACFVAPPKPLGVSPPGGFYFFSK